MIVLESTAKHLSGQNTKKHLHQKTLLFIFNCINKQQKAPFLNMVMLPITNDRSRQQFVRSNYKDKDSIEQAFYFRDLKSTNYYKDIDSTSC